MNESTRVAGLEVARRPVAGTGLWVHVVRDQDALLEEMDDGAFAASDERMPYFGTLWPAGEALATRVAAEPPGAWSGLRVLDLGCGVGAPGLAAARAGAAVTCLDWEARSLAFVEAAASAQGLSIEAAIVADWRRPPRLGVFDRVLAADVLYEARNVVPVATFLAAHLTADGEAWIAEPGRDHARALPAALLGAGLVDRSEPLGTTGVSLIRVARRVAP